ncbi:torsin-1A-like [Gadus macrocephalus]|uniref:torsin-1A-like n=1 Tax=Gadus macrocephalus TaxID=80720 RepID=UPI0028CB894B|nr:torsin-1A-like [Gadus macrocephalus]
MTGFMNNDNPKKSLVLSFHGTTGTGKTLASRLIVKNIYKEGMDSRFVHFFNPVINFPHASQVETYKSQLQHWIRGNVTNCAHSMFIFDEMDKMHPGIIDGIKPFMDYQYKLDGVAYQKAIFIFLSNAGGKIIRESTLVSWKAGKKREELKLEDVKTALSSFVFDFYGESNVVDFFIPFLPLERQHIVQCIMVEMVAMGLQPDHNKACEMADKIVNYIPDDERRISVSGCMMIARRLRYFMQ